MSKPKQKIAIVVGPNASGKSAIAVALARRCNGEIISADSRQVYRGLDLGSGKITKHEMRGVRHHLLDVADPRHQFSVVAFKRLATEAIADIRAHGKIPILVGGTGFWIDAVAYNRTFPEVSPNPILRRKLGAKTAPQLLAMLAAIDPGRAKTVDPQNPQRIIRAIEIARVLGRVPKLRQSSPYDVLWLGTRCSRNVQNIRLKKRLRERLRAGMVSEARRLRREGLSWKRFYELGLEYRFLAAHLRGELSKRDMIAGLRHAIRDYARRQMVWFKQNPAIHWIATKREAEGLLKKFLTR